jgi:hypothetical protein
MAQYGIFNDDQAAHISATGQETLLFQDRPAWLVTFSGPGLVIQSNGSAGASGTSATALMVHHEQNVAIDAATGQALESFS